MKIWSHWAHFSFFLLLLFLFIASLKLWRSRLSRVMYSMANCLLLMKVGVCVCQPTPVFRCALEWVCPCVCVSQRSLMPGWWRIHSEIPTDWPLIGFLVSESEEGGGGRGLRLYREPQCHLLVRIGKIPFSSLLGSVLGFWLSLSRSLSFHNHKVPSKNKSIFA